MKNKLKNLLALLLVAVMVLSFVACDMDTDTAGKTNETGKPTEEENNTSFSIDKTEQTNETGKPTEEENNTSFSIDKTEQTDDKWKMTYKECQIKNKLDSFTTAEDGTEFVVVFFEIENISEESQNFSVFWEEFYLDGVKTAQTIYGVAINNSFQLTAVPVEPGRKAKGYFLFQTSPDWKELEIIYDESLTNENEENVMKFTLTKNAE